MVKYLIQCGDTFGPPNALVKPKPLPTSPICTKGSGCSAPKADMSKVTCHFCNHKGHYTNTCASKTGCHHLGKSPSGVETGLSHSTIDTPTNVSNVPPDFPTQNTEAPADPLSDVSQTSDGAEIFVPNISYSGNTLHHIIVEDVHTMQTRSQTRAEGKAQAVIS
ncbi:hypothetical protein DSO57_1025457 [Entomophthora muscae]|uniref:Uncharacterized protein n=1 Tax=Entomophthora muscae TaxID=34485 RepID=A0ACC2UBF3_9FUNG|nr:hypothetical protein DSO57_1025457 [Entomophthora muscae]